MKKLNFYLKTSRPGLWFATIWLYILPTGQIDGIWTTLPFCIGLFYICFPLNFLVYGWNDIVDFDADKVNPRKDSFLFGAKGTKAQLKNLWIAILIVQLICLPFLYKYAGTHIFWLFGGFILINGLYNLPKHGLRSKPPLELLCQIGYLLVVPLSISINNTPPMRMEAYVYLLLFAWQSHLIGEVMDIDPDREAGKKTTATVLGMRNTKLLIIGLVAIEVLMLVFIFKDLIFAAMLAAGLLWLLVDLFVLYKTKRYSLQEMKLFAYMSNAVGFVSMAYVWWSGCLF